MEVNDRYMGAARRFLDVIPPLFHRVSSELRSAGEEGEVVTVAQVRAMAFLHHHPCSLNELAHWHEVSAATMSRLISTLVERGWVQREADPADRRQVILNLTADGECAWSSIVERSVEHLATILGALSIEEVAGMEMALAGLARVLGTRHGSGEDETTSDLPSYCE